MDFEVCTQVIDTILLQVLGTLLTPTVSLIHKPNYNYQYYYNDFGDLYSLTFIAPLTRGGGGGVLDHTYILGDMLRALK